MHSGLTTGGSPPPLDPRDDSLSHLHPSVGVVREWQLSALEGVLDRYWSLTEMRHQDVAITEVARACVESAYSKSPIAGTESGDSVLTHHLERIQNPMTPSSFVPTVGDQSTLHSILHLVSRWAVDHARLTPLVAGKITTEEFLRSFSLDWVQREIISEKISPIALELKAGHLRIDGKSRGSMGYAPRRAPVVMIADADTFGITRRHEYVHRFLNEHPMQDTLSPGVLLYAALKNSGYAVNTELGQSDPICDGRTLENIAAKELLSGCHEELICQSMAGGTLGLSISGIPPKIDPNGAGFSEVLLCISQNRIFFASYGFIIQSMMLELLSTMPSGPFDLSKRPGELLRDLWSSFHSALGGILAGQEVVTKDPNRQRRFEALLISLQPSEYHTIPMLMNHS